MTENLAIQSDAGVAQSVERGMPILNGTSDSTFTDWVN